MGPGVESLMAHNQSPSVFRWGFSISTRLPLTAEARTKHLKSLLTTSQHTSRRSRGRSAHVSLLVGADINQCCRRMLFRSPQQDKTSLANLQGLSDRLLPTRLSLVRNKTWVRRLPVNYSQNCTRVVEKRRCLSSRRTPPFTTRGEVHKRLK